MSFKYFNGDDAYFKASLDSKQQNYSVKKQYPSQNFHYKVNQKIVGNFDWL